MNDLKEFIKKNKNEDDNEIKLFFLFLDYCLLIIKTNKIYNIKKNKKLYKGSIFWFPRKVLTK